MQYDWVVRNKFAIRVTYEVTVEELPLPALPGL